MGIEGIQRLIRLDRGLAHFVLLGCSSPEGTRELKTSLSTPPPFRSDNFDGGGFVFYSPLGAMMIGIVQKTENSDVPVELSPSQALGLWHRVALAQVEGEAPDLTLRQTAILLHIYLVPPPHTVRALASVLGVTKPVITRALDSMGALGLVDRERDEKDRRNVVIKRTVAGALYLEKFGDLIIDKARET